VVHARRGDPTLAAECYERGWAKDLSREAWGECVNAYRDEASALLGMKTRQKERDNLAHP
jgi:hypothetical protein